jgi:hypothetical protein
VESPSPSSDLLDRLEDLREATGASDREAIRRILKDLVPTFESPQATSRPLVRPDPPGEVRLDRTH